MGKYLDIARKALEGFEQKGAAAIPINDPAPGSRWDDLLTDVASVKGAVEEMTRHLISNHGMNEPQARQQALESLFGGDRRKRQAEEAAKLFRARGWIEIHSTYMGTAIYLIRNGNVKTPDPAITRYTLKEVEALAGISEAELKTLHAAKEIFGGEIIKVGMQ